MTSGGFLVRKGLDASRDPIELVHSEHLMMREVLDAIDRLVLEPSGRSPEAALELYGFLRDEYLAHHLDEDEALFPLLRKRAEPEDRIDEILDRLEADHETGNGLIDKILGILKAFIKNEASLRDEDFENAIILPIARARLTKADLDGIYNRMLARRGLDRVTSGKAT
jgi:hemerythrin-like domain-containing protein